MKNDQILKSSHFTCLCPKGSQHVVKIPLELFLSANIALTYNFLFKVAYYSFRTMRALISARAAQGTRKHHARAKSFEPAEEIPRTQKQNGGSRKKFLVFQVGFRGVFTIGRLCLGLITEKKVLSYGCRS